MASKDNEMVKMWLFHPLKDSILIHYVHKFDNSKRRAKLLELLECEKIEYTSIEFDGYIYYVLQDENGSYSKHPIQHLPNFSATKVIGKIGLGGYPTPMEGTYGIFCGKWNNELEKEEYCDMNLSVAEFIKKAKEVIG